MTTADPNAKRQQDITLFQSKDFAALVDPPAGLDALGKTVDVEVNVGVVSGFDVVGRVIVGATALNVDVDVTAVKVGVGGITVEVTVGVGRTVEVPGLPGLRQRGSLLVSR